MYSLVAGSGTMMGAYSSANYLRSVPLDCLLVAVKTSLAWMPLRERKTKLTNFYIGVFCCRSAELLARPSLNDSALQ